MFKVNLKKKQIISKFFLWFFISILVRKIQENPQKSCILSYLNVATKMKILAFSWSTFSKIFRFLKIKKKNCHPWIQSLCKNEINIILNFEKLKWKIWKYLKQDKVFNNNAKKKIKDVLASMKLFLPSIYAQRMIKILHHQSANHRWLPVLELDSILKNWDQNNNETYKPKIKYNPFHETKVIFIHFPANIQPKPVVPHNMMNKLT